MIATVRNANYVKLDSVEAFLLVLLVYVVFKVACIIVKEQVHLHVRHVLHGL